MFPRTKIILILSICIVFSSLIIGASIFSGIWLTSKKNTTKIDHEELPGNNRTSMSTTSSTTSNNDQNTQTLRSTTTITQRIQTTTSTTAALTAVPTCKFIAQPLDLQENGSHIYPTDLVMADLNHDNYEDIIFLGAYRHVAIVLNDGHGQFKNIRKYSFPGKFDIDKFLLIDMNNDTHLDIVCLSFSGDMFGILFGTGDGKFSSAQNFMKGRAAYTSDIDAGDLNGDNYIDLVFSLEYANAISIAIRHPNANSFSFSFQSFQLDTRPNRIVLDDFDGDDILDIVVSPKYDQQLEIIFGIGNGSFDSTTTVIVYDSLASDWKVLDLNQDSYLDIVLIHPIASRITTIWGNENREFRERIEYSTGLYTNPKALSANYLNNDPYIDFALYYSRSYQIGIFLGSPSGHLQYDQTIDLNRTENYFQLDISDLNNDNHSDMVVIEAGKSRIYIYRQNC